MSLKSLVTSGGTTKQIPDGEKLLVADGIDASNAVAPSMLSIGTDAAQTSGITIGQVSPFTTTFTGDVDIQGNINTVGGTTFTDDVTFQGNTTFGNGPSDTVTFAGTTTVIGDIAFNGAGYRVTNMLDPTLAQDAATKAYADTKLALAGGTMSGAINMGSQKITNLANGTASSDAINLSQLNAVAAFEYDEEIFVAPNGSDLTGTGAVLQPFATVGAALTAITDATPTKRYAIRVTAGAYTEASALNIKPNVFIVGTMKDSVRLTAPSFGLTASWNAGSGVDNRSGFAQITLLGAATFDFASVTSSAGKLYCQSVSFANNVALAGYNAINQAQFDSCIFFGTFTNTAVNVGVHTNNVHYGNISLTQHASLPTLFIATGGYCGGNITATTTVSDFARRCAMFLRSFPSENLTVDGPSSYADFTVDSGSRNVPTSPNGGTLVPMDAVTVTKTVAPVVTSTYNSGDWNRQWLFAFNYCNFSTGTELYVGTVDTAYDPAGSATGYPVYVQPDQYGLKVNVNGGVLDMRTANATGTGISGNVDVTTGTSVNGNSGDVTLTTGAVSGTGTRGVISLDGREIDANSTKIVNVANGTNPNDAVNYSQLSAIVSGVSSVGATAPLLSSGGSTPNISISTAGASNGDVLTYNGAAWAAAAPSVTAPASPAASIQFNNAGAFGGSTNLQWNGSGGANALATPIVSLAEGSAPSATANYGKLYALSADSRPYFMDDGGQAFNLTLDRFNTLTPAASVAIDTSPALPIFNSLSLNQNTTFTTSNLGNGRSASVRVVGDASTRTLTFPGTWTWLGSGAPTSLAAGDVGYLSITAYGATDADVVAAWSYENQPAAVTGSGVDNQIAVWSGTNTQDGSAALTFNGTTLGVTGGITQSGGAVSLTGNAASSLTTSSGALTLTSAAAATWSTAAGALTLDAAAALNLGTTNATSVSVAKAGVTTTVNGPLTQTAGAVVFNNSSGATNFTVKSSGNASMLFVDGTNDRVSIGTSGSTHTFNVGSGSSANFCVASGGRIHTYDGTAPTNGQLLIGDGSVGVQNFAKATLTAGTNIAVTNGAGSITIDLTGQVAVANGGTGQSSLTSGALVVGNGGSAVNTLSPGSNGQVLTVVGGAWAASSLPAATDYSIVAIAGGTAGNATTVAGANAIATAASTSRVAGIAKDGSSVYVLGIVTCSLETGASFSAGVPVYLSASEAGKVTNSAPTGTGEVVAELGIATASDSGGTVTVLWQPKSIVVL